ncbi:unnamed protein product [Allacma fusca]|uniref:Uncharacterized protein n=1 Tax=Allacma fusca TaxID=39272 RepID=A0A8J2PSN8_9HEXA|nr:unnamed protein product [Allacma fusca]
MTPDLFEESKAQNVITTIRNLYADKSTPPTSGGVNNERNNEDQMFTRTCAEIAELTPEEFNYMEELLFDFILREWEYSTNCCFRTLNFIEHIFQYICSIASEDIVHQYLKYFAQPNMPAQVRLWLYPTVLQTYRSRFEYDQETEDDCFSSMEKFVCEIDPANMTLSNSKSLILLLKEAFLSFTSATDTAVDKKLLTGFLTCRESIVKLCETDENRIVILDLLSKCLTKKPTVTTLLLSSMLLIFLQTTFQLTQSSLSTIHPFLEKLINGASHHRNITVTNFVTEVVTSFLNSLQVSDEKLVFDIMKGLRIKLKPVESFKPGRSDSQEKPSSQKSNNSSPARPGNSSGEKMLDLLEKLLIKMKSSNVSFDSKSETERLEKIISNLNSFL